ILHALNRLIDAYQIPTQACCLAHISTQLAALDRGAPVDLLFQSVAGTQKANESFGITLNMLKEGRERVLEHHQQRFSPRRRGDAENNNASVIPEDTTLVKADDQPGKPALNNPTPLSPRLRAFAVNQNLNDHNVMYFETGQGSALSAEAHHGV